MSVDLDITESYLKLRLKSACLDSKTFVKPGYSVYEPKIISTPARSSALYELYHKFLKSAREPYKSEMPLWNVAYHCLSNGQQFIAFSTASEGLTVRIEIHETVDGIAPGKLLVLCDPMISLDREMFQIEELLEPRKFILEFIHPAILDEIKDTKLIADVEISDVN